MLQGFTVELHHSVILIKINLMQQLVKRCGRCKKKTLLVFLIIHISKWRQTNYHSNDTQCGRKQRSQH